MQQIFALLLKSLWKALKVTQDHNTIQIPDIVYDNSIMYAMVKLSRQVGSFLFFCLKG